MSRAEGYKHRVRKRGSDVWGTGRKAELRGIIVGGETRQTFLLMFTRNYAAAWRAAAPLCTNGQLTSVNNAAGYRLVTWGSKALIGASVGERGKAALSIQKRVKQTLGFRYAPSSPNICLPVPCKGLGLRRWIWGFATQFLCMNQ